MTGVLDPFCGFGTAVAVEVSQVRVGDHTRPLVRQLGAALAELLTFREDLVRVNTAAVPAGPGYDHSHVLILTRAARPSATTLP